MFTDQNASQCIGHGSITYIFRQKKMKYQIFSTHLWILKTNSVSVNSLNYVTSKVLDHLAHKKGKLIQIKSAAKITAARNNG